jgi:hypothetical protein
MLGLGNARLLRAGAVSLPPSIRHETSASSPGALALPGKCRAATHPLPRPRPPSPLPVRCPSVPSCLPVPLQLTFALDRGFVSSYTDQPRTWMLIPDPRQDSSLERSLLAPPSRVRLARFDSSLPSLAVQQPTHVDSLPLLPTARNPVTNPAEVSKTRLQLDGELQGRKHVAAVPSRVVAGAVAADIPVVPASLKAGPSGKVYSGAIDCLRKTWKYEGVRGVQRGLGAAVSFARFVGLGAEGREMGGRGWELMPFCGLVWCCSIRIRLR